MSEGIVSVACVPVNVIIILIWNYLVSDFGVSPPSKRVRRMEHEEVEQLQPTLDSATIGEGVQEDVLWYTAAVL